MTVWIFVSKVMSVFKYALDQDNRVAIKIVIVKIVIAASDERLTIPTAPLTNYVIHLPVAHSLPPPIMTCKNTKE